MDGITSASPIALLGSLLAHAAFGAAVIGFGAGSERVEPVKPPTELVFFETEQPAIEPALPEVAEEPPVVRRVARVAPARPAPTEAPAPAPEPAPPVTAPAPVEEVAPIAAEAPAVGLSADTTVGSDAKGFAAGSASVGAKTGVGSAQGGRGAVSLQGVVGGTGDRSRAAGLAEGRNWDCPFPQEAEDEGVENARVTLQVQIGADGSMQKAVVVSDPGFGFGQEARRCAMRRRWLSQLDRTGAPVAGHATVVVNFVR